ncbi:unnamed protein product, partial [Nesidiocoris tenuis]
MESENTLLATIYFSLTAKHTNSIRTNTVTIWVAPEGLRMLLNKVKNDYGNPEVLITENGYPDDGSDPLNDTERINYYE